MLAVGLEAREYCAEAEADYWNLTLENFFTNSIPLNSELLALNAQFNFLPKPFLLSSLIFYFYVAKAGAKTSN